MINIGLTVSIGSENESFFENGIKQNIIILRDVLLKTGKVKNVYYVNIGSQKDLSKSPWKQYEKWIIDMPTALNNVNLLISAGVFLDGKTVDLAKKKNIKVVVHLMGNEYYVFNERSLFKNEDNSFISKVAGYDAVWISPHLYETNKDLWEVLTETKAYVAPYIWSPEFLEQQAMTTYNPSGNVKKRISIMESNLTLVKTSIFPMIISEKLYNKYPDDIQNVMVVGSEHLAKKKSFVKFAGSLNIYKAGKMTFEKRYRTAFVLPKFTDIVLSHQRDCGLNYLYFDAAWYGYPLVHNSSYVKELGWYYGDFAGDDAVEQLHEVITNIDNSEESRLEYMKKSREYISQYLPGHERNVQGYRDLLDKFLFFSFKL